MKVGDLVRFRKAPGHPCAGALGVVVNIVTHTETYTSSGCKNYIVLTAQGNEHRCWQGNLEEVNEGRRFG
jgi:hypothetical protein